MMCNAHDRRKEPQVVAAVLVDADDDGPVVYYSARTVTRSLTGSTARSTDGQRILRILSRPPAYRVIAGASGRQTLTSFL
jgi:hypothetical protein